MDAAESGRHSFLSFVQYNCPPANDEDRGGYLQEYLREWLERGGGIEAVGGEFTIFLQTVILTLQELFEDPSLFDYLGPARPNRFRRRMTGIFHDEGGGAVCFHEDQFRRMVFQYTCRLRETQVK